MTLSIVLDKDLAPGLAANAAAVLAMSVGRRYSEWIGADLEDASGSPHPGISSVPVPVLAAEAGEIPRIRAAALEGGRLWVAGFTATAQRAREYGSYAAELSAKAPEELRYAGIALVGDAADLKRLTGSLPLFR